ncbi:hypothetical protein FC56_GL000882 [Lentilactobacillus senioris DSM 24302 = JCM 17472]|uniref:Fluoride-specific ion channel FluC n=1 Tax=Lentilactobacillus senioris DSM 24302 = JCM 17472 TaxID=1423802 RepID=A0A0R2CNJ1_9LACO|nr:CrcB family protein [Lentilactobacillus senioris]KRM93217.1 hypothetical protein FC56_GL000882 [Lentilactobacillus senioris DSM 24302 = JCM 17472]
MNLLLVGGGAMVGASARYGISNLVKKYILITFPVATLVINLLGCFLMGLLLAQGWGDSIWLLLGVGALGGFTTFSTFMNEAAMLINARSWGRLLAYLVISYVGGWSLLWLGLQI